MCNIKEEIWRKILKIILQFFLLFMESIIMLTFRWIWQFLDNFLRNLNLKILQAMINMVATEAVIIAYLLDQIYFKLEINLFPLILLACFNSFHIVNVLVMYKEISNGMQCFSCLFAAVFTTTSEKHYFVCRSSIWFQIFFMLI